LTPERKARQQLFEVWMMQKQGAAWVSSHSPQIIHSNSALQAATILVAMASEKNFWRPKFWRKSPIGNQQIKRESYLKNYQ